MRLILTDDEGVVIDSIEVARKDFAAARRSPLAALSLVEQLGPPDSSLGI